MTISRPTADKVQYDDIAPILADVTTKYKGKIWGLPYYTYTQGQFYRQDLFDDATGAGCLQGQVRL